MKRIILFISLFTVLGVFTIHAQTPETVETPALSPAQDDVQFTSGKQYKKLQSTLGLSDEQMIKVKAVMQERKAQAEQDKAAAGSDELKRHELTKARMKVYDEKLNAILTAEQQQKYATYKAAMKERGRERRGKF
jgi:Spy/CpxP family protein refolding chaperone